MKTVNYNLKYSNSFLLSYVCGCSCDSPPHLRGRTFDTIDASELRCNGSWAIATFALVIASMVGFGAIMLAATVVVCSRTPIGLYVRAKKQFSYAKVTPKTETVDLEWDPSADM